MKKIGIWIRVSTEDQAKGDSPEHHEKRARMYAELQGWEVVTLYDLSGVSGKSVLKNSEAQRMLADVQSGAIDSLVFSKLARLARNTKELLEIADIFRKLDAHLVALDENIDTATPSGRFFYTLLSAMAQWEREEIADRVSSSHNTRAKLGKRVSGIAPFGYQWVDGKMELHPDEAPIRKLMYELFIEHKRKQRVARILNERGYRTRTGAKFSYSTVARLLKDPIAKGVRRTFYTERSKTNQSWTYKDESDWVFQEAPSIISETEWNEVHAILDEQAKNHKPVAKVPKHLFTGKLECECGGPMKHRPETRKYVCSTCKRKITGADALAIFREQLRGYSYSEKEIREDLKKYSGERSTLLAELQSLTKSRSQVFNEMEQALELHREGQIQTKRFRSFFDPLEERLNEIEAAIPKLEARIDHLNHQESLIEDIVSDAQDLYDSFPKLSHDDKRGIIDIVLQKMVIHEQDVDVHVKFLTPSMTALNSVDPLPPLTSPERLELSHHNHIDAWCQGGELPTAFCLLYPVNKAA